jgi:hypothetical protein
VVETILVDILVNIISNTIFVAVVVVVGWLIFVFTRRAQMLRFYGVEASRRIVIYISNLGSVAAAGSTATPGYPEAVAPFREFLVASKFRDLFHYLLPSLSERPGMLYHLLISDVQVQLRPSPPNEHYIEPSASFITLGTPAHNRVSRFIEEAYTPRAHVLSEPAGITSIKVWDMEPVRDETVGFIERIVDKEEGRTLFYIAGLSEAGTIGAAHFLRTEWAHLHRRYGEKSGFVILLRFDEEDHTRWSVLFERASPPSYRIMKPVHLDE